jgi:protein gp37
MRGLGLDHWWDLTWNPVGGCSHAMLQDGRASPGCGLCYAQQEAGTKTWPYAGSAGVHNGVTDVKGKRRVFNGKLTVAPPNHSIWDVPLRWPGAKNPKLGPGRPSLIFVGDMSDLFHEGEGRPDAIIDRVCGTIAISDHIGLLLTKRARRMADYFTAKPQHIVQLWQPKLWLGFSAENQECFDERWPDMRRLTELGYFIFVSIAPMIGPVILPPDFLALRDRVWVIVAGEQGPHAMCRDMNPDWARAVRDQCLEAGIPFFMKQMSAGKPFPRDLREYRQFPSMPTPWFSGKG